MRRLARLAVVTAVLLLIAVAGAVAWLAYSPSAARWLVQELVVRFEGQLSVGGVEGTLADGISLRDMVYRHGELRIEIDRAQAAWYWSALLDYRAQFRRLALGRVSVLLAPGSERAQLPETLAIPLAISIDDGRIDRLVVLTGAQELGIEDIVFRGSVGPSQHIIDALELRSTQGRVTGRARIGTTQPFVLQAQMSFSPQAVDSLPSADLKLSGNLSEVSAQFSAQASWMAASGSATLNPFEQVLVKKLYANAERIMVHQRFPDTVNAELRGTLDLRQVAQDRFEGELQVLNADPGELGQSKLPVAGLAARLSGNADGIDIAGLELRMAKGAPLVGEGRLDAKALDLKLDTRALDLKAWDQRLVATKLAGSLRVLASRDEQSLAALLRQADYRIELDVLKQGDALAIRRAAAAARGGSLTLSGQVSLQSRHAFDAHGRLQRFDPSAFFEVPPARIDADLSAKGSLAPELNARIEMRAKGQGPRGEAFSADAQAVVSKRRVSDLRAKLTVGRNELNVSGAHGAPSDTLAFEARLPVLNDLDQRYSGALEGKGQLTGDLMRPAISLDANATRLAAPGGLSIGAMRVRAMLPADWNKPLDVEVLAQEVRIDTTRVDKVAAVVRGTPRSHTIEARAQGKDLNLEMRSTGGLTSLRAWSGELARLDVLEPTRVALLAPARVSLAPEKIEIGSFTLSALDARFSSGPLLWTPDMLRSSGEFTRLRIAPLLEKLAPTMKSSLVLTGDWKVEARAGVLRGGLNVVREDGDIVLTGDMHLPLALTALQVQANVENNRLRATARASSALGEFRAQLSSELARRGNLWVLPASAPLAVEAQGDFASIAWLGPLIHPNAIVSGKLALHVSGKGSVGQPNLDGKIQGESLALRSPATGIALSDGMLDATFVNDRLAVRALRFKGGEGFVTVSGEAGLTKATSAKLRIDAKKLMLVNRRDVQLELDAGGDVVMGEGAVRIKADARVTQGYLDLLRKADRPALATDIHVKADKPAKPARQPLQFFVDLSTDFGDRFNVRASGVGIGANTALKPISGDFKARIQGKVHTRSDANQIPQTTGRLNIVDGSYTALGRTFKVERGNLNFVGPLDNPGLDIYVAAATNTLRFNPDVGISITGTAATPRIRLVSVPELPETEKLSWLLFGRGGQGSEYSVGSTTGQIASPVTQFGWQLSQNLYVAYEQSATGTSNLVRVYSQLTERIAVQAGAGDASSLFLLYTFTFK